MGIEIDGWKFRHRGNPKVEYTIISKRWVGDTQWIWHNKSNTDLLYSVTAVMFLQYAEPVPDFFEKCKTYEHSLTGNRCTVWHVHEMALGKVGVAQYTNGLPRLFKQEDWDRGNWREV